MEDISHIITYLTIVTTHMENDEFYWNLKPPGDFLTFFFQINAHLWIFIGDSTWQCLGTDTHLKAPCFCWTGGTPGEVVTKSSRLRLQRHNTWWDLWSIPRHGTVIPICLVGQGHPVLKNIRFRQLGWWQQPPKKWENKIDVPTKPPTSNDRNLVCHTSDGL